MSWHHFWHCRSHYYYYNKKNKSWLCWDLPLQRECGWCERAPAPAAREDPRKASAFPSPDWWEKELLWRRAFSCQGSAARKRVPSLCQGRSQHSWLSSAPLHLAGKRRICLGELAAPSLHSPALEKILVEDNLTYGLLREATQPQAMVKGARVGPSLEMHQQPQCLAYLAHASEEQWGSCRKLHLGKGQRRILAAAGTFWGLCRKAEQPLKTPGESRIGEERAQQGRLLSLDSLSDHGPVSWRRRQSRSTESRVQSRG